MSTAVETPLQPRDRKATEDSSHTSCTERLEPLQVQEATTESAQGVTVAPLTTNGWKKCFITVTILITYAFLNAGISIIAPFYPIVARHHNVATYISGFVVAMAPLCLAVMSPLIGYFLPYLGVKFTQLAGLMWAGGSLILFGFVSKMPTPTLFILFSFLLRIVEGVGTAMYSSVSYTVLIQLYPNKKGTVVSLLQLLTSLGFAAGPAIGGGLVEAGGFTLPFLVVGGCIVVTFPFLVMLVKPKECASVKLPWQPVLKLLSSPTFVLLVVSVLLATAANAAVLTYFGQFLHIEQFKLSEGIIGVIYLAASVAYGVGTLFAGQLTDKLNAPRVLIIAGLVFTLTGCTFIGPATFITTPKLWLSIPARLVTAGGLSFVIVPFYSDATEIAKMLHIAETDIASTLSGILIGAISGGECSGPIIGGFLVYKLGFPSMAAIFSVILLACALMLVITTVIERVWKLCHRNKSNKVIATKEDMVLVDIMCQTH